MQENGMQHRNLTKINAFHEFKRSNNYCPIIEVKNNSFEKFRRSYAVVEEARGLYEVSALSLRDVVLNIDYYEITALKCKIFARSSFKNTCIMYEKQVLVLRNWQVPKKFLYKFAMKD